MNPIIRQPKVTETYLFRPQKQGESCTHYLIEYFSSAEKGTKHVLPKGEYHLCKHQLPDEHLNRSFFVHVKDVRDVIFDGNDSKIICDDPRTFLRLVHCNRVNVQLFRLKFHKPVATEGWGIDVGVYRDYPHKTTSILQAEDNSPRRDKWKVDNSKWWRAGDVDFPFDADEKAIFRHYEVEGHGFLAYGGNNITFERNRIYSWPGMGFSFENVDFGAAVLHNRIAVDTDSDDFVSCSRDGAHFNGCGRNILVEGNHFSDHGDDSLNIHGRWGIVTEVDGRRSTVEFVNGFGRHFRVPLGATEQIEIRHPDMTLKGRTTADVYGSKASSVDGVHFYSYSLIPEHRIDVEPGDLIEFTNRLGSTFRVRGNTFENNFGRGIVASARDGEISHNILRNQTANAIRIGPDYGWYNLAGCSHNLVIHSNLIEGGCRQAEIHAPASRFRAAIAVGSQIKGDQWEAERSIHALINITNNTLQDVPIGIEVRSCVDYSTSGNLFRDVETAIIQEQ